MGGFSILPSGKIFEGEGESLLDHLAIGPLAFNEDARKYGRIGAALFGAAAGAGAAGGGAAGGGDLGMFNAGSGGASSLAPGEIGTGSKALSPQMLSRALSNMGGSSQAINGAMPTPVSPEEGTTTWEDLLNWWYSKPKPTIGNDVMTVRG